MKRGTLILFLLFAELLLPLAHGVVKPLQFPYVPHSHLTNGDMCDVDSDDFSEYRYPEDIAVCARNVSPYRKRDIYRAYGIQEKCYSEYTIDHFIPLSLGGSNNLKNLWPESRAIKRLRYNLENELYLKLREGKISQREAVERIKQAKMNPQPPVPPSVKFCL